MGDGPGRCVHPAYSNYPIVDAEAVMDEQRAPEEIWISMVKHPVTDDTSDVINYGLVLGIGDDSDVRYIRADIAEKRIDQALNAHRSAVRELSLAHQRIAELKKQVIDLEIALKDANDPYAFSR